MQEDAAFLRNRRFLLQSKNKSFYKSPLRVDQLNIKTSYNVGVSFVEAQVTTLYFPQAGNTNCALASPLPVKTIRLYGGPKKHYRRFYYEEEFDRVGVHPGS